MNGNRQTPEMIAQTNKSHAFARDVLSSDAYFKTYITQWLQAAHAKGFQEGIEWERQRVKEHKKSKAKQTPHPEANV